MDSRLNLAQNASDSRLRNIKNEKPARDMSDGFWGAPSGARTLDPNIKSVVLYQLS